MRRLLMFGDLASTGFGTVTMDLGRQLIELGVDTRFMSQNELPSLPEPFLSRTVDASTFVMGIDDGPEGTGQQVAVGTSDAIPSLLRGEADVMLASGKAWGEWKPDAVLVLGDYVAVRNVVGQYVEAFSGVPTFHYVPIEGIGLPPRWKLMWDVIQPVAMSRFGQAEIAKVTGSVPPFVYHGVDAGAFHPVSPKDPIRIPIDEPGEGPTERVLLSKLHCKLAWQSYLGIPPDPDRLMVLRTDRNMPRKGYPVLLRAMAPVLERHPEMDLVLHCDEADQGGYIPDSVSKLPAAVQTQIHFTEAAGVSRRLLVSLYNAADVYVSTSAEGFGLTIAEAIACGVPAVGIDYSAVPEVIGPAGQLVPVGMLFDNPYDHFWAFPDERLFGRAVEYLITHPARYREMAEAGPRHVRRMFDWRHAAAQFIEIMSAPGAAGAVEVAA